MKARLPKKVYNEVKACKLDKGSADIVAQAVRDWAIEKGATHFTHVFEPLTMLTAEKHDSFVSLPDEDGKVMMDFTGKELCESEPGGSSFSRKILHFMGYDFTDLRKGGCNWNHSLYPGSILLIHR